MKIRRLMFDQAELLRIYEQVWNPSVFNVLAFYELNKTLHLFSQCITFTHTNRPLWYGRIDYQKDIKSYVPFYYLGTTEMLMVNNPDPIALAEAMEQSLVLLRTYPLRYHC